MKLPSQIRKQGKRQLTIGSAHPGNLNCGLLFHCGSPSGSEVVVVVVAVAIVESCKDGLVLPNSKSNANPTQYLPVFKISKSYNKFSPYENTPVQC